MKLEYEFISLSTLADVTGIVTAIVTLVVAVLLYRKFNGTQSIIDEQTKTVMKLIKFLNDINSLIFIYENSENTSMQNRVEIYNFRWRLKNGLESLVKDVSKYPQYSNNSIMSLYTELLNQSNEIYLPKEIASRIKTIEIFSWKGIELKELPKNYIKFHFNGKFKDEATIDISTGKESTSLIAEKGNTPLDLSKHFEDFEKIYIESVNWIKKNNPDIYKSLNLNKTKVNGFNF